MYWIKYYLNGVCIRKSLGPDREKAKKIQKKVESKIAKLKQKQREMTVIKTFAGDDNE